MSIASVIVVSNRFPALASGFTGKVEAALDAGVAAGIAAADARTPVDTGALRANKTIQRSPGSRTITWNQHYAVYQNFGTSRGVPANHFAEAAVDAATPVIQAGIAGALD
jgi:HK97 gp10 family phage protein